MAPSQGRGIGVYEQSREDEQGACKGEDASEVKIGEHDRRGKVRDDPRAQRRPQSAKPLSHSHPPKLGSFLSKSLLERTPQGTSHFTAGATRMHGASLVYRTARPSEVQALSGVSIVDVVSGADHVIARVANGGLLCWGRGESGQLGQGKMSHESTPTLVTIAAEKSKVRLVACGAAFSAALTETGTLYTWGQNMGGQLGHGDCIKKAVPTTVGGMLLRRHVHHVACGYEHMIALTTGREVFTWGRNTFGQLGHGEGNADSPTPRELRVMSGLDIKQLDAGEHHSCVLTSWGEIYTWGRGDFGQLGHGDQLSKDVPTLMKALDHRVQAASLSVGADFMFLIDVSGAVYSWGRNSFGQLAHGVPFMHDATKTRVPVDEPSPRLVAYFSQRPKGQAPILVSSIACGAHHVVAVSDCRRVVYAWGRCQHGTLGLDPSDRFNGKYKPEPQVVKTLPDIAVVKVTCGDNHTVLLAESAERKSLVLSWGRGSYGQLGHGSGKRYGAAVKRDSIVAMVNRMNKAPTAESEESSEQSLEEGMMTPSFSASFSRTQSINFPHGSFLSRARVPSKKQPAAAESLAASRGSVRPQSADPLRSSYAAITRLASTGTYADMPLTFTARFLMEHTQRAPYLKHEQDPDPMSIQAIIALSHSQTPAATTPLAASPVFTRDESGFSIFAHRSRKSKLEAAPAVPELGTTLATH